MKTLPALQPRELSIQHQHTLATLEVDALKDITLAAQHTGVDPGLVLAQVDRTVDELRSDTLMALEPQSRKLTAALEQFKLDQIRHEVERQRTILAQRLHSIDVGLQRLTLTYSWHLLWVPYTAIGLAVGCDSLMNFKQLQVIMPNMLAAIAVSLLLTASLGVAVHALGAKIREAVSRQAKWLWLGIGLVGAGALFFVLGLIRHAYLDQMGQAGSGFLSSPWLWMIFNVFFFAGAVFISARYLPSKAQWRERTQWANLKKELTDTQALDDEQVRILRTAESQQAETLQQLGHLKSMETNMLNNLEAQRDRIKATLLKEYRLRGGHYHDDDTAITHPFNKA